MSCNKIAFESKEEAVRFMRDVSHFKRAKGEARNLTVYRCNNCEQYHYTSQSKSKARRVRFNIRKSK